MTLLLREAREGREGALDEVFTLLYEDLRRIAASRLRQSAASTLRPTEVVHEVYLRLLGRGTPADRRIFFGYASRAMRDVIIDHHRRAGAQKRGGGVRGRDILAMEVGEEQPVSDLAALGEALESLERHDEVGARIVSLRYFIGLSVEEIAELLGVSSRTVDRQWRYARAWLRKSLRA